jgi:hypothetical protein
MELEHLGTFRPRYACRRSDFDNSIMVDQNRGMRHARRPTSIHQTAQFDASERQFSPFHELCPAEEAPSAVSKHPALINPVFKQPASTFQQVVFPD